MLLYNIQSIVHKVICEVLLQSEKTALMRWTAIFKASPVGFDTSIHLIYPSLPDGSVFTDKKIHYVPANLTKLIKRSSVT